MAFLDTKFVNRQKKAATSISAMHGSKSSSSMSQPHVAAAENTSESQISAKNGFHIKYTPMQLYPKMLKVKVIDK